MFKKIILNLESFVLAIFLFGLIILLVLSNTVLSKNYLLNYLEKNNYYEQYYNHINETLKGYIIQSGLEEDILQSLYDQEKVKEDINILINNIYQNKDEKIDTNIIKVRLENIINKQLELNNQLINQEEKESISSFVNTIQEVYLDEIIISKNLIDEIKPLYLKLDKIVFFLIIVFSILSIITILIINLITKNLKKSIQKVSVSLLTASLLLIFIKILLGNRFRHILIINALFSKILIGYIYQIINLFLILGIVFGILSLVGCIIKVDKK